MSLLDGLPQVSSVFGVDLKTFSCIIAAMGIVHPLVFACTLWYRLSHLILTMWLLVIVYCAASIMLMVGILHTNTFLMEFWVWYAFVFIVLMVLLLLLLTFVAAAWDQRGRVMCAIVAIVWYIFTIYFAIVVNSYRMDISK